MRSQKHQIHLIVTLPERKPQAKNCYETTKWLQQCKLSCIQRVAGWRFLFSLFIITRVIQSFSHSSSHIELCAAHFLRFVRLAFLLHKSTINTENWVSLKELKAQRQIFIFEIKQKESLADLRTWQLSACSQSAFTVATYFKLFTFFR